MMRWLDQLLCGLVTGHDFIASYNQTTRQIYWVCTSCLKQQQGWVVEKTRPRKRFDGDKARHQMKKVS